MVDCNEFCDTYKLRPFNVRIYPCFLAGISDTGVCGHTDFRPTPGWRHTFEDHNSCVASNVVLHPLWGDDLGLSDGNVCIDLMHVSKFGVLQYFLASAILLFFRDWPLARESFDDRMQFLLGAMDNLYDMQDVGHGKRLPFLTCKAVMNSSLARDLDVRGLRVSRVCPCVSPGLD